MQGDSVITADSASLPVDSIATSIVKDTLTKDYVVYDSLFFYSSPFPIADSNFISVLPAVPIPQYHSGSVRPKDAIAESSLLTLLFLVIFFVLRLVGKGGEHAILQLKKILSSDERIYSTNVTPKTLYPFFWLIDMIILTYVVRLYLQEFTDYFIDRSGGQLLWRILLYVVTFWTVRQLLMFLTGSVFFKSTQISKWFSGMMMIMTLFSFSMLPLIIIYETGLHLSSNILYIWPIIFGFLPKVFQFAQIPKLFSLRNRGYLYLILYLCALEILPLLLFFKGLVLLK